MPAAPAVTHDRRRLAAATGRDPASVSIHRVTRRTVLIWSRPDHRARHTPAQVRGNRGPRASNRQPSWPSPLLVADRCAVWCRPVLLVDFHAGRFALAALAGLLIGVTKTGVPGFGILAVPLMVLAVGDARHSAGVAVAVALPGRPVRDRRVPAPRARAAAVRAAALGAGRHRAGRDHAGRARARAAAAGRGDRDRDDRASLAARAWPPPPRTWRRRARGTAAIAGGRRRATAPRPGSRPPSPTPPARS